MEFDQKLIAALVGVRPSRLMKSDFTTLFLYSIDLRKEQYIRAQQKCGVDNIKTIYQVKEDEDKADGIKIFTCTDWAEATKSGVPTN